VHDPSTGKVITRVAAAQKDDVDLAVKAAKKAFTEGDWAKMAPLVRQDLMMEFANRINAHAEELTAIECNDNGKPLNATCLIKEDPSVEKTSSSPGVTRTAIRPNSRLAFAV
jgi:acyl-CoA reductase-like NAD-dependent aldehyde dehydrogenase